MQFLAGLDIEGNYVKHKFSHCVAARNNENPSKIFYYYSKTEVSTAGLWNSPMVEPRDLRTKGCEACNIGMDHCRIMTQSCSGTSVQSTMFK